MAILIVLLTLLMFFQHTDAGTPVVNAEAIATSKRAKAKISCGIEGKLKNKESYSGSAYCYVDMTTESGTEDRRKRTTIWAYVYRTWWPFGRLKVRHSPTVSVLILKTTCESSYAYAEGNLGSAEEEAEASYN
ncbi:hypothetical protein C6501_07715 [Candidatus Poribacteria bacterium]|nr:MAG: hypothetical protein C6501_07715 [Candidatus Poribacteria bacterium]